MRSKSSTDALIRGGQTTQHWFRMAFQVLKTSLVMGFLLFLLTYSILCLLFYEFEKIQLTAVYYLAKFNVESVGRPDLELRYKADGEWQTNAAASIYQNAQLAELSSRYAEKAFEFAYWSAVPGFIAICLAGIVFYRSGQKMDGDTHIRGTRLVSLKELKHFANSKWKGYEQKFGRDFKQGPQYTLAGVKFPPNCVEAQTGIVGTVGTGKTNAIKEILNTMRQNSGRAIVYDRMGTLVQSFYDPETDIIVNPFDQRSHSWSPFGEADTPEFFTQMAEVLIPEPSGSGDRFWTQAARIVFDYTAQQIARSPNASNTKLRQAILDISNEDLARLIEKTPGRHLLNEEIAKTSGSIRANLIAELRFLEFLRDDAEPFSIRDWVKTSETGFVFLTGDAEHAAATRNIISTCFEVAANALMTCEQTHDPSIFFVIDEAPTLNKMPFLVKSLAEIRQFGGAFIVGFQVYSQLEDLYGPKGAQTIAGTLNNRVIFNTPDYDTAEIASKSLGSEDVDELRASMTVGAHETRDGVGWASQRTERRIVSPSQVQSLPQFKAYIRFAYDAPTAEVTFRPIDLPPKAEKFLAYHGKGFSTGSLLAGAHDDKSGTIDSARTNVAVAEDNQDFTAWREKLVDSGYAIFAAGGTHEETLVQHYRTMKRKGFHDDEIPAPKLSVSFVPPEGSPDENQTQFPLMSQGPCPITHSTQIGSQLANNVEGTEEAQLSLPMDQGNGPKTTHGQRSKSHEPTNPPANAKSRPPRKSVPPKEAKSAPEAKANSVWDNTFAAFGDDIQ